MDEIMDLVEIFEEQDRAITLHDIDPYAGRCLNCGKRIPWEEAGDFAHEVCDFHRS